MLTQQSLPILYNFRRCPYAMRARLALYYSEIFVEVREVALRNKPPEMLSSSPKGTVPVLVLANGEVIDESLDIMFWALGKNDPNHLLNAKHLLTAKKLIEQNDTIFKPRLDKYKYSARFPEYSTQEYREKCKPFLVELESHLSPSSFLMGDKLTLVDIAILPFIRQFAGVDKAWFDASIYINLQVWLEQFTQSAAFKQIMHKYELWNGKIYTHSNI